MNSEPPADTKVRCTCGRTIALSEARSDGWVKIQEPYHDLELRGAPLIIKGTCWRCYREQRAADNV